MPWLELLHAPSGGPAIGSRYALPEGATQFDIGASSEVELPFAVEKLEPRAARLIRTGQRWALKFIDLGTLDGKVVKRSAPQVLEHGSLLDFGEARLVLAFCEQGNAAWPRSPQLEASLAEAPEDETRWLVYSDFLQERGDPWGLELAGRSRGRTRARIQAMGPLAEPWLADVFSAHLNALGGVEGIQLREAAALVFKRPCERACDVLAHLGACKAASTLSWLALGGQVASGCGEESIVELATVLLEALLRSPPLLGLRSLTLGQSETRLLLPSLEPLLVRLRARHPRLTVSASSLLQGCAQTLHLRLLELPAGLQLRPRHPVGAPALKVGESVMVHRAGGPGGLRLGTDESCTLRLEGVGGAAVPEGVLCAWFSKGSWLLYGGRPGVDKGLPGLTLNDNELSPGRRLFAEDEFRFEPGVRFRVEK